MPLRVFPVQQLGAYPSHSAQSIGDGRAGMGANYMPTFPLTPFAYICKVATALRRPAPPNLNTRLLVKEFSASSRGICPTLNRREQLPQIISGWSFGFIVRRTYEANSFYAFICVRVWSYWVEAFKSMHYTYLHYVV